MSFYGETEDAPRALWEGSSWNKFEKSKGKTMDRANSFIASRSGKNVEKADVGVIVVIDPFSTGQLLALSVSKAGYKCVRLL